MDPSDTERAATTWKQIIKKKKNLVRSLVDNWIAAVEMYLWKGAFRDRCIPWHFDIHVSIRSHKNLHLGLFIKRKNNNNKKARTDKPRNRQESDKDSRVEERWIIKCAYASRKDETRRVARLIVESLRLRDLVGKCTSPLLETSTWRTRHNETITNPLGTLNRMEW